MRTIIHCDMNNFYTSVELLEHPELTNLPVAICGNPENRHGIILAKNKIAKKFGVLTAETIYQAVKKCPELVLLPPHHEKYTYFYHKTNEIYRRYTDLIEPFSIDELWLVPGKVAPVIITEDMVKGMKKGAVIIDISIDQGGNCALTPPGKKEWKHGVLIEGIRYPHHT